MFQIEDLERAEPVVSRSTIDFGFEDAKGIFVVTTVVIMLALVFLVLFELEIPVGVAPRFTIWLAIFLLLVPILIYIFSFWAYRQILFNEQVRIALNLYNSDADNGKFRKKIIEKTAIRLEWLKHAVEEMTENSKDVKGNLKFTFCGKSYEIPVKLSNKSFPPDTLGQELRKQIDIEASQALTSVYGVSLSAYFPVLIILELVVILGFVVPIYELLSTGYIGVFNLSLWHGTVAVNSWVVEWAFFGAFVHSFFNMMDRVPRKDIRPRFYLNILIRYIIAVALASLFYLGIELFVTTETTGQPSMGLIAGFAFTIGMFPNVFLRTIQQGFSGKMKVTLSLDTPLSKLPGISRMEASRLWEEGIYNISQLADSNVFSLHKRTHYDYCRLSTIIGSALLWRAIGGETPVDSNDKEKKNRMTVLKESGINSIQDLYTFVIEPSSKTENDTETQKPNDKHLELLVKKLGLDKEFVLNAAISYTKYHEQIRIPLESVESLVLQS